MIDAQKLIEEIKIKYKPKIYSFKNIENLNNFKAIIYFYLNSNFENTVFYGKTKRKNKKLRLSEQQQKGFNNFKLIGILECFTDKNMDACERFLKNQLFERPALSSSDEVFLYKNEGKIFIENLFNLDEIFFYKIVPSNDLELKNELKKIAKSKKCLNDLKWELEVQKSFSNKPNLLKKFNKEYNLMFTGDKVKSIDFYSFNGETIKELKKLNENEINFRSFSFTKIGKNYHNFRISPFKILKSIKPPFNKRKIKEKGIYHLYYKSKYLCELNLNENSIDFESIKGKFNKGIILCDNLNKFLLFKNLDETSILRNISLGKIVFRLTAQNGKITSLTLRLNNKKNLKYLFKNCI